MSNSISNYTNINIRSLVYISWIITLIFLLYNNNYKIFIMPRFSLLLAISLIIVLLFVLSNIGKPNKHSLDFVISGIFLIIPVCFIIFSNDSSLDSYSYHIRNVNLEGIINTINFGQNKKRVFIENETNEYTIKEILDNADFFNGKQIATEGLYLNQANTEIPDMGVVFRFNVICCAADGIPMGILIKNDIISGIKDNDWIKVHGTFHLEQNDSFNKAYMIPDKVEKIAKPSAGDQYLY